uniref:non-specific serine/threonine protein kinase n=1 Tax=Fusarium oxysporum (strain Fo5176) TaxID=660025 RepID=A0A0D2Y179_FUSOF
MAAVATKLGYGANSTVWLARDLNRWRWSTEKYIGGVIPPDILKILLQMILLGLDYLHNECHVIHADLKPDNIMIRIEDSKMFEKDAIEEYNNPLPEKQLDDRTIYLSRNNYGPLARPTGTIQLVDFDLAVHSKSGELHYGAIQGEIYRAPEVIIDSGYSYSADIWSLGVMITALLGPAPQDLLTKGRRSTLYYQEDGELKDPSRKPSNFNLESTLTYIAGEEKQRFVQFVKRMIAWRPEERSTAKELLDDPWLYKDFPRD